MKRLTCYQLEPIAPRIVPGRGNRAWMDATPERFAYRCLPLTIANAYGWEILLPCRVVATWNGGAEIGDVEIEIDDPDWASKKFAAAHFGSGVVTFQLFYLFRTEPGVGLCARGVPNAPKDGIAPLEGLIETDWLPFTFTMNWKFTRPGRVVFEKDEPYCFVTPMRYRALDELVPEIMPIDADPAFNAEYVAMREARRDFNTRLLADDPAAVTQGWQKWYMRGETATGAKPNPDHVSKLLLATPQRRATASAAGAAAVAPPEES